jgi:hypothetical protein
MRVAQTDREPRLLPRRVRGAIDQHYVLAAVGLLAEENETTARMLVRQELLPAIPHS